VAGPYDAIVRATARNINQLGRLPGARWALHAAGVDIQALLGDLAAAFPPPRRNGLLRADRRLGQRARRHDLVRRYQHTTGRTVSAGSAIAALINS
jgi:hypothetical protein